MMTVAHLAAGVLAWMLWHANGAPLPLWSLLAACILALLPDIDTTRSIPGKLAPPLAAFFDRACGHRTATHSLLAVGLVAGVAWLLAPLAWPALALAYASHLLLDMLIGRGGIALFWPLPGRITLSAWRDDGPAPARLLVALVIACGLVAFWPQLAALAVAPTRSAAVSVFNEPSPTATATATETPEATPAPSIHLSFALPSGASLSVLRVRAGDTIREGQLLAAWEQDAPTPWPSPTSPTLNASPAPPALPIAAAAPQIGDSSATISAKAALTALQSAQPAERSAMLAEQQREQTAAARKLADARQALDLLQPMHERQQAEAQSTVDAAHRAFLDAQAAAALPIDPLDPNAPTIKLKNETQVHQAEATLRAALDAQTRMRSQQGIERQRAETAVSQAQADVEALPASQAAVLAKLDADNAGAIARARGALEAAQAAAAAQARSSSHAQQLIVATVQADARQVASAATTEARVWSELAEATQTSYSAAAAATAQAQPTPAPDRVVSRAAGRIVDISAQETGGVLVVTLEVVP